MKKRFGHKQQGFTLIELMIGLLIGLIVLSGALYIFVITVKSSRDVLFSARLNQDLSAATAIIVSDIRRAGAWRQASGNSSPYDDIGKDFNIVSGANCVLYNYDEDNNSTITSEEYRGVKLDGSVLKMKVSGVDMSSCSTGVWESITDDSFMTITEATFTDESVCLINQTVSAAGAVCPGSVGSNEVSLVREVSITISAEVNSDTDWKKKVEASVRLRNDFYAK